MAGKLAKCPECGQKMRFPEAVVDAEEATGAAPAEVPPLEAQPPADIPAGDEYPLQMPAASSSSRFTDEDFAEPAPPPAAAEPGRHPCPMCGEMIADGAAKCRFCGAVFDPALRRQEEKKKRKRSYGSEDEDLTTGDWLLAILCSGIGCIMGLIYLIQGKPKAGKMLGVSIVCSVVWNVISYMIRAMSEGQHTFR
jgi:predicted RNA-binding Zn-ribbon protein involved in translation (DUF1610 family)